MTPRSLVIVFSTLFLLSPAAFADNVDFYKFKPKPENLPKSYKRLRGVEGIDAKHVHAFSIYGGKCKSGKLPDNSGKSDCDYGSVRSELREQKRGKSFFSAFPQPSPVWYGFDLLIPNNYPTKGQQVPAFNIFAQWKAESCPHMAISHWTRPNHENALFLFLSKHVGPWENHDCEAVAVKKITNMPETKGRWTRFEIFVNWSSGRDGKVEVYVNGTKKLTYHGPNLDPNNITETGKRSNKNYFSFGNYLSRSKGIDKIRPGTIYFANVHRAKSREALFD